MSELKAYVARKIDDGMCDPVPCIEVYPKSEADAVIAELTKKNDDYRYTIAVLRKEKSHQNYKRCLAMAKWCAKNVDHLNSEGYIYEQQGYKHELADCIKGTEFYHKWYNYWSKLAEKFEEAK